METRRILGWVWAMLWMAIPGMSQEGEGVSNKVKINYGAPNQEEKIGIINNAKEHRYYALIMGVNEYEDPNIGSLDEPINDATKLRDVLVNDYTFENENISFLKNPTNADIIIAFEKLTKEVQYLL